MLLIDLLSKFLHFHKYYYSILIDEECLTGVASLFSQNTLMLIYCFIDFSVVGKKSKANILFFVSKSNLSV